MTFYLVAGIITSFYFHIYPLHILLICGIFTLLIGVLLHFTKTIISRLPWLNFLLCFTFFCTGISTQSIHTQSHLKNHYTKVIDSTAQEVHSVQFRIHEVLKPGIYHDRYIAKILSVNNIKASGTILLNVEKDSLKNDLPVDAIFVARTEFRSLNPPLNPHQFDYKSYLKKKHIYHQLFVESHSLLKLDSRPSTLVGYAGQVREKVNIKLNAYNFDPDELAIINALLLGQRQDISSEIYDSYTQAGAIHILAVSGLHVGIILLLLNHTLQFLDFLKHGRTLKIVVLVILLWSYAIIAGLSASVVRAVTMFTVFAIAMNLKRPTNVYNTLAISAFLILLFKPNFLFDVGFQLSYLAVLAIVSIEPLLSGLWHPNYKIVSFFWRTLTVTIAAQFGIIPLSLYYFHQFPGLFFLSNLVIIPFLGLILGLGFCVIILALCNLLPLFLVDTYGNIISTLNTFVTWVSKQEAFLFQNIPFSLEYVLFSYLVLISAFFCLTFKNYKSVIFLLTTVIGFQVFTIYEKSTESNAFVVFHKSRHTVIGLKTNSHLQVHHNLNTDSLLTENLIANYFVGEQIKTIDTANIKRVYAFDNKKMLVVDSLNVYQVKRFSPDIVLLRNSPKINLSRLIDSLMPKLIISDGSNFRSYQERWAKTCKTKKIPFHQTNKKGAFIYHY